MYRMTSCLVTLAVLAGMRQVKAEIIVYSWLGFIEATGSGDPWRCGGDGSPWTKTDGKPYELSVHVDMEFTDQIPSPEQASFNADTADLLLDGRYRVNPIGRITVHFWDGAFSGTQDIVHVSFQGEHDGVRQPLAFDVRLPSDSFTFSPGPRDPPPVFPDTTPLLAGGAGSGGTYTTYLREDTPVTARIIPEPSVLALGSTGALGLLAYACRKRRRRRP